VGQRERRDHQRRDGRSHGYASAEVNRAEVNDAGSSNHSAHPRSDDQRAKPRACPADAVLRSLRRDIKPFRDFRDPPATHQDLSDDPVPLRQVLNSAHEPGGFGAVADRIGKVGNHVDARRVCACLRACGRGVAMQVGAQTQDCCRQPSTDASLVPQPGCREAHVRFGHNVLGIGPVRRVRGCQPDQEGAVFPRRLKTTVHSSTSGFLAQGSRPPSHGTTPTAKD
jgi:hypothetical protein